MKKRKKRKSTVETQIVRKTAKMKKIINSINQYSAEQYAEGWKREKPHSFRIRNNLKAICKSLISAGLILSLTCGSGNGLVQQSFLNDALSLFTKGELSATVLTAYAEEGDGDETTGVTDLLHADNTPKETVHITDLDSYLTFARECRYDAYSKNKIVELNTDLDLTGKTVDEASVAYFAGIFRGNNHTISGIDMNESVGCAGLFRIVAPGAVISSLNVEGDITPVGTQEKVGGIAGDNHGTIENCSFKGVISSSQSTGGIAGYNESDGIIRFCKVSGSILGTTYTGGICGYNDGVIASCRNEARVNTSYTDVPFSTDEISSALQSLMMGGRINAPETVDYRMDAGGIVGFNTGYLVFCDNEGDVGYEHVGYNVGGIAGRTGGFINKCTNSGTVKGRKDVGGIAGQLQPYMQADFSESVITQLQNQLESLNGTTQAAIATAQGAVSSSVSQLQALAAQTQSAIEASKTLQTISSVIPQTGDEASADLETVIDAAENAANDPETAAQELKDKIENSQEYADAVAAAEAGKEQAEAEKEQAQAEAAAKEARLQELMKNEAARSEAVNALYTSLSDLTTQVNALNTQVESGANNVFGSFYNINSQFAGITGTLSQAVNKATDTAEDPSSRFTDDSVEQIDTATIGRITCSANTGDVDADINVGGIVGQANVESDLDPERDIFQIGESSLDAAFSVTCIIDRSSSNARITGHTEYTGGIAGNMQMGVCALSSVMGVLEASGNFTGGIVGYSKSTIMNCASACEMTGKDYVGGIAGYGQTIADCSTMATITDASQYIGQIAGRVENIDVASVYDNFYCAFDVYGIDGVSYKGIAEKTDYETLACTLSGAQMLGQNETDETNEGAGDDGTGDGAGNLNDGDVAGDTTDIDANRYTAEYRTLCKNLFDTLTLTFVADGEKVGTLTYAYKEETNPDVIPAVPEKDGFTGSFLPNFPDKIMENRTVEAVYERRRALIGGGYKREGVQDVVLCEGFFEVGSSLEVTVLEPEGEELERLRVVIPEDGADVHTIRFLPPAVGKNGNDACLIHLVSGDGKTSGIPELTAFGAYETFETDSNNFIITVTKKTESDADIMLMAAATFGALILIAVIALIKRLKNRGKKRTA